MSAPASRAGLLAPALAIAFAAVLGTIVVHAWRDHRADAITRWRAEAGARVLAAAEPGQAVAVRLAESPAVTRARVVAEDAGPKKYRFLRRLRYAAHDDAARQGAALTPESDPDKGAADAYVEGRAGPAVIALASGGVRAAQPTPGAGVAVVDGAPLPPPALPWLQVVLAALLAYGAWALMLLRPPRSRWQAPIGAAVAAVALLWALLAGAGAIEAAVSGAADAFGERVVAAMAAPGAGPVGLPVRPAATGAVGAMLAAAVLLPLVLVAVVGFISRSRRSPHRAAYTYVAPAIIGLAVLVLAPFTVGFALAFTRFDHGTFTWIGLQNFVRILSSEGYGLTHPLSFYFTLGVTVLWTGLNVALHAAIGLALALVLREPTLRFKGVYRVLLIVPWAVPNYITALIWKGMFNKQYGTVNQLLGWFGVEPVSWFGSFWAAFTANLTTNTWLGFPFMMVVSLGALQSIPRDLYEAADVDGASRWAQFRHITLPLLKPALLPAIILGSIWTFNMFNIIYLVSGGAPNGSTDILITEAYRWAFEQDRYGYAAAYSVVIFLILLGYSLVTQRVARAAEGAFE